MATATTINGKSSKIIRFAPGEPTTVTLGTDPARAEEGVNQFDKPDWLYRCQGPDPKMFYADAELHRRIAATAKLGDEIVITRHKAGAARNSKNIWTVIRLTPDPVTAETVQTADGPELHWPDGPGYYDEWEARRQAAAPPPPPPPVAPPAPPAPAPARDPRLNAGSPQEARLLHCYLAAVRMAAHVKHYAKESEGMLLEPRYEDIRAMAATLFIQGQQQQGGGGNR